jgi:hypothetical protein
MRLTRSFTLVAVLALFALPASAVAQPSVSGYDNFGPQVQEEIQQQNPADEGGGGGPAGGDDSGAPAPAAAAASDEGGELPFTGLDVALVLGAGLMLVGMGFGIRRMIRPTEVA